MPVTMLADGEQLSDAELGALLDSWSEQYPVAGGDVLRLICAGRPETLLGRVTGLLARAALDPDELADIEIVEGSIGEVLRAGQFVLARDEPMARAVADRGSVALREPRAPVRPASHCAALRRMIGFTGVQWIADARRASPDGAEARRFVRCLQAARLEPGLAWPGPGGDELVLGPDEERDLRRAEQRRPAPGGSLAVWHGPPIEAGRLGGWAATACRVSSVTPTIPSAWPALLSGFTRVWVASERAREHLVAAGVADTRLRVLADAPAGPPATAERIALLTLEALSGVGGYRVDSAAAG